MRIAIQSVLDQTFRDFELILLDDCPEDTRADVVAEFNDKRIVYAVNERNLGIAGARNRLVEMARGEYLAVFDSDDICRPDRLEKEAAFLDAHPDVGVVSSFCVHTPSGWLVSRPLTDRAIRIKLAYGCAMVHTATMFRASVLRESGIRYEEKFTVAEDWRIFWRLAAHTRLATIPEPLVVYRRHDSNTSLVQGGKYVDANAAMSADVKRETPELLRAFERGEFYSARIVVSGAWSHRPFDPNSASSIAEAARCAYKFFPEAETLYPAFDMDAARDSGLVPATDVVPSVANPDFGERPGIAAAVVRVFRKRRKKMPAFRPGFDTPADAFKSAALYILADVSHFADGDAGRRSVDAALREIALAHSAGAAVAVLWPAGGTSNEAEEKIKAALHLALDSAPGHGDRFLLLGVDSPSMEECFRLLSETISSQDGDSPHRAP